MNADLAMQQALDRLHQVGVGGLTDTERTLAAIWCFESKVANGGLAHFYRSDAGDLAVHAPAAFRAVGAESLAVIAEEANALFRSEGVPASREQRAERLRALSPADLQTIDRLEARYYESSPDLEDRIEAYLSRRATPLRS